MTTGRILAVLFAVHLMWAATVRAQDLNNLPPVAAGPDQTDQVEAQVPGQVQLARWDMLLNQAGADAVKKVAQPADSTSKTFAAMTANGFELRQALADAITNNGVEHVSQNMAYAQSYGDPSGSSLMIPQGMFLNYYNNGRSQNRSNIQLSGNAQQSADSVLREAGDKIKIKLNEQQFNMQINEGGRNSTRVRGTMSIQYDGELNPGDAVLMLAPITAPSKTVYYELIVWETFKADSAAIQLFQNERDSGWWCQNGPAKLRKWAAVASIWEAQASHEAEKVPAKYIKKLDDGKEIQLLGLCRPSDAPFCWWDGDGNAISNGPNNNVGYEGDPPTGLWAAFEVTGSGKEYRMEHPATQPINDNNNNPPEDQPYSQMEATLVGDGTPQVEIGVTVGPWIELAQVNVGDTKQFEGVTFTITRPQSQGQQNFYVQFGQDKSSDNVFALSAVGPDGKEANSYSYEQAIQFGHPTFTGNRSMIAQFQDMAMTDVQYYRLCERKRQFVTFDGFAANPLTPVKTDFTPDELAAAMKTKADQVEAQRKKSVDEALKTQQAARKDWDAVVADRTNPPKGTLKFFVEAAGNDDEKTVRAMIASDNAADSTALDTIAHMLTLGESNWKKANDKLGAEKMLELQQSNNGAMVLMDFGLEFTQMGWTKADDGTWTSGRGGTPLIIRKDDSGQYVLDLGPVVREKGADQGMKQMAAVQEKIAKVLDQPDVTIDQLREAAAFNPNGP
jgi:hypothetical protein